MKFNNEELNSQFERDGYCKFPLLEEEQILALRAFAERELLTKDIQNTDYGMYVSLEEDFDLKTRAKEYVHEVVVPKLSEHIIDFQIHLGGYLIKAPDHSKYTFPHQDWTFVDNDSEDVSATVWISLYDLKEENGTLGFLKGSHQFLNFPVGSPSPAVPTPLMGKEGDVFPYLKFEPVKAGDALVFNNKTIHAAQPNNGDYFRVAVGVGITPASTTLYHYYLNPENDSEFLKLKASEEFFLTYNNDDLFELYQQGKTPDYCKVVDRISVQSDNYPDVETILLNSTEFGNLQTSNTIDFITHFGREESKKEELVKEHEIEAPDNQWVDDRTFFQKYTPLNIFMEAKMRMKKLTK